MRRRLQYSSTVFLPHKNLTHKLQTPNPFSGSSRLGSDHGKRMKTRIYRERKRYEGRRSANKVNSHGGIDDGKQLVKRL